MQISPCTASISRIQGPFFSYSRLAFLEKLNQAFANGACSRVVPVSVVVSIPQVINDINVT